MRTVSRSYLDAPNRAERQKESMRTAWEATSPVTYRSNRSAASDRFRRLNRTAANGRSATLMAPHAADLRAQ